ncbi:hypothetical protein [Novosphingobium sp.]|uniref:hypothetical protein n=1 Tax=Novosphingobium sp. TaxID=1874826 RepID=UPI0025F7F8FB|nr:hypothetical protein [Novosphingobium sp.]
MGDAADGRLGLTFSHSESTGAAVEADLILPPLVPTRPRADGWTPQRQRDFLEALAGSGSVSGAARSVGMSRESAYVLRRRADARGFAQAWDAARLLAAEHLVDLAWDRAVQGELRPLVWHGEVVGEVRHYDNRLLLGLIAQNRKVLAEQGLIAPSEVTAAVAADWPAALDRAARGEALDEAAARGRAQDQAERVTECGAVEDGPLSGPGIPAPLAPITDGYGHELAEPQQLCIGLYTITWDTQRAQWLTNWPAPAHWAGDEYRRLDGDRLAPIARCADDPGSTAQGEPWPEAEHYARTLSAEEEAGLERLDADEERARAGRLALYRRAAFGLATPAERASLAAAGWPG